MHFDPTTGQAEAPAATGALFMKTTTSQVKGQSLVLTIEVVRSQDAAQENGN